MSILLVDPDPHTCKFYAVNLRSNGHTTHEANTLSAAWHASTVLHPGLIVMELCGFDGLEFLTRLAEHHDTAAIPVLVITTHTEPVPALSEMKNVLQVLTKPITRHTLLTEVNAILGVRLNAGALLA
jgi:DNA-binding response OmpR family regulator